jgi:light-regulated signal transduction histidine kinase (bacteriophytochrome)
MLKSSNADLENFIYAASHDLRSPISNLEGLVTILKNELGGKIQNSELSLIQMINTSISRFKQTIFDLTELTTFQKRAEEYIEPVNLTEIVDDVQINIQNKIVESKAEISTDFKVQEIIFARKNLSSLILNLLSNAIKYRSPKRPLKIEISSRKKGKYTILEVSDNGLGFLPEQKDKLFLMFKRLHTHVDGTGVGLYIVKKIVDNSGGKIEVDSLLDQGSKFKIFIKNTSK